MVVGSGCLVLDGGASVHGIIDPRDQVFWLSPSVHSGCCVEAMYIPLTKGRKTRSWGR